MRNTLFEKAVRHKVYLKLIESGEFSEYWKFIFPNGTEIPISITNENNGIKINCTCKHCSLHVDSMCSYCLALILKRCGK